MALSPRAAEQLGRVPGLRLVGARGRLDDRRVRRVRAHRLSARRPLAPPLRPGRDALGSHPPHADRRRLAGDPGRDGAHHGGDRREWRPEGAPRVAVHAPRPARVPRRRLPRRPLHLPGRIRLRRAPVPPGPASDARDGGGRHRAGGGAYLPRAWGRAVGGGRLPRDPGLPRAHGGRRLRPDAAALPPVSRRGRARGACLPARGAAAAGGRRRPCGGRDRDDRPGGRVGLVARLDADPLAVFAAPRGRGGRIASPLWPAGPWAASWARRSCGRGRSRRCGPSGSAPSPRRWCSWPWWAGGSP